MSATKITNDLLDRATKARIPEVGSIFAVAAGLFAIAAQLAIMNERSATQEASPPIDQGEGR